MTIFDLLLRVAIAAVALTAFTGFLLKERKSWLMSYVQHFCGALFIFSGYVKAVDPLGTAYKMEQYFGEFEFTFKETWLNFIAPMFPWLKEHALAVSVLMIIFEIVLGFMLILGSRPRFTSWAFLLLVLFFTALTGFTYLTGHVPTDSNFFAFGTWGDWTESNMRVTDCGCFGDFLKLKPKVSFFKDVFLLFPALFFMFYRRGMHQLFTPKIRSIVLWVVGIAFTVFCWRNISWDEPIFDFRPFRAGTDVRAQKEFETEQSDLANKVTGYEMTNKANGKVVTLAIDQYMKEFKSYPKEEWELKQVKDNPPFETSKISDFEISDTEGASMTDSILMEENYSFMVTAYKLKTDGQKIDAAQQAHFSTVINPVVKAAEAAGYKVFCVTGPNDPAVIEQFRHTTQSAYPFYTADDLLLKTIQRSNPGLVLWKNGKIIQKWHHNKMPSFEEIKSGYLK